MAQLQCINCGSSLTEEDLFCGSCGTAVAVADHGGLGPEPVRVKTMVPGAAWAAASPQAQPAPAPGAARGSARSNE